MHVSKPEPPYSFWFTTGALFVPETLAVARQFARNPDWESVTAITRSENLLRQRTAANTTRILRKIRHCLDELSPAELEHLVGAEPADQRLLLFIAAFRLNFFVDEVGQFIGLGAGHQDLPADYPVSLVPVPHAWLVTGSTLASLPGGRSAVAISLSLCRGPSPRRRKRNLPRRLSGNLYGTKVTTSLAKILPCPAGSV